MANHAEATSPHASRVFLSWIQTEFEPARLVSSSISGIVSALLTIVESVSYAALIFSGTLAVHLSTGIGIALTTAAVAGLVMAVTSSYPGTVALPQNKVAPILALIAASVVATMPAGATDQQVLLTVVAAIVVSSLMTGLFMAALGFFKLGGLIRFIPYPVIAGFLAGTGWLLLLGSVKAMTGTAVTLSSIPGLFEKSLLVRWIPGLVFAVTAHILMRRVKHFLVMPGLLFTAFAVFYAVLFANGISVDHARESGWLIHVASEGGLWKFMTLASLTGAWWPAVVSQAGSVATILLIGAVAVLLNSSALELASKQEMDLDRELKSAGAANIFAGLAGGMVGFTSLTITGLGLKMGSKSRLVGLITAAVCAAVLLLGAGVLSYFPEPIVGGMLMFLGFEFLTEWVYETRKALPFSDWVIVIMILVVVGLFGFLHGVLVGVIAAALMFVFNYSRTKFIKYELNGTHHHSNVDRPAKHRKIIRAKGERIHILRLFGYIFFGTANNLLQRIKARAADPGSAPLRFLVLDFREVGGIDSSAVVSLVKMNQLAHKENFRVLFVHLSDAVRRQLEKGGLMDAAPRCWQEFEDLDYGLEWCEDRLLKAEGVGPAAEICTLADHLEELVPGTLDYAKLEKYLERSELPKGHRLINAGDPSDDLFFIESGQVSVLMTLEGGETIRMRKMGDGTVVGELGLYLNQPRTASVVTEEPSVVYRLSRKALETMEEKNPQTAATFHRFMTQLLAERLINTDKTLKTLVD